MLVVFCYTKNRMLQILVIQLDNYILNSEWIDFADL